jgi:hypothetical protein
MTRIKDNGTKLTLEQYETKVTLELPYSATTATELLKLFKGAALALGYSEKGWNNAVFDYCEDHTDSDYIDSIPEEMLDKAFAEHNAHEEGFDIIKVFDIDAYVEGTTEDNYDEGGRPIGDNNYKSEE